MNKKLKEKTQEWMSLERKTLEQRKIADQFYDTELMNLIVSEYISNNKKSVIEKVDYLIISVGTSYEPLVLNISLLKPRKILMLYTDKSESTLDKVVELCGLKPQSYEKRRVDGVDPMSIYREIRRAYLAWKKPDRMYIDFTGGTKAMSAACALAGAMIDIQMIYVSTEDYLTDFRKPNPGSERLTYIENPVAVFGDLEVDKAIELMSRWNYAGASEKLEVLKEQIPDPSVRQQLEFLYTLARAYENWDALDFVPACRYMDLLCTQLKRDRKLHPDYLLMDSITRIDAQRKCLESLSRIPDLQAQKKREEILRSDEIMHALMFTMYQNASVRERQEKYDMATLLLYRLLEMIEQRRLIRYGIYASDPDYQHADYAAAPCEEFKGKEPAEQLQLLKDRVFRFRKQMFRNPDAYLPQQIALLDGFMILGALGDPITEGQDHNSLNTLKRIRSMVYLRNNSIFAHGLGPVGKESYEKFRDFVTEMFVAFCVVERVSFKTYEQTVTYISVHQSADSIPGWES